MGDFQGPMDNFGGGFGPDNFANGGNFNTNPPPQIPPGNPLQQQMPGMFQRTVTLYIYTLPKRWLGECGRNFLFVMLCAIWHHLYNLKNLKKPMEENYILKVTFLRVYFQVF